jgi:CPA1 family monovalent cation:H+ antiporter
MYILLIVIAAIAVSALANRKDLPASVVIVVIASAISFVPSIPRFELGPELILGFVMPPLLFSASRSFSLVRFFENGRAIVGLGVGLVVANMFLVAGALNLLIPAISGAVAAVIASVVSPPDTITTVSHGREIGLTRAVTEVLTGESIVNDAAALTLFTIASMRLTGSHAFIENTVALFAYAATTGIVIGALLGFITIFIRAYLGNPTLETALGLVLPFAAFHLAEHIHASGVLATVAAGFVLASGSIFGQRLNPTVYRTRLREGEIWPVIDTLLELVVFAYIGLQVRFVLTDLRDSDTSISRAIAVTAIVLALIVTLRFAWVFYWYWSRRRKVIRRRNRHAYRYRWNRVFRQVLAARRSRGVPFTTRQRHPTTAEKVLISWCGMRGIVTLAAAASIPFTTVQGDPVPHRELIQFVAFSVAIITLVVQASTLPVLARRMHLDTESDEADERTERAVAERFAAMGRDQPDAADSSIFERQREAVIRAVERHIVDDIAATTVVRRLDLAEAAAMADRE